MRLREAERHREERMQRKEHLRGGVAALAGYIEICISAVVLIAIVITGVQVVREVFGLIENPNAHENFTVFMGYAFNLIIGVEFIRMLSRHTPGATIEVLMFAIARSMVVEHTSPLENLISVVTIALIFAIRKYLFVPSFDAAAVGPDGAQDAPPPADRA